MKNKITATFWPWPGRIDWKLLVFLLLFLNFKLLIKLAAIILIYVWRPGFSFGFRTRNSRLPLFYVLLPLIAIIAWLLNGVETGMHYVFVLVTGTLFWVLCILAVHQVKRSVEKEDPQTLQQTILVFFVINILVSLAVYFSIVWETGAINPYRYQGNYQKYFIGTGDYIKGITFDTSVTNAIISAMGVIYFLLRGKYMFVILCMTVLLLTGSNLTDLLLVCTLLYMFFFQSNHDQKSMIIVCLLMLLTFLVKISPQNNQYVITAMQKVFDLKRPGNPGEKKEIPITQKPDSTLTAEEKKQKFASLYLDSINLSLAGKLKQRILPGILSTTGSMDRPVVPGDSIHTPKFQHRHDTNAIEKKMLQFAGTQLQASSRLAAQSKLPGKLVAFQQTCRFLKQRPAKLFAGNGIGNFSSKLAFRATAMGFTGSYPQQFAYINQDFRSNHLNLYLYYFTGKDDYHSVVNSPDSTYDQLLSEYGLAGLFSFACFYLAFFAKRIRRHSWAIPLLLFMSGVFFIGYWFEHLSVVVLFELLLFLNIKETTETKFETARS